MSLNCLSLSHKSHQRQSSPYNIDTRWRFKFSPLIHCLCFSLHPQRLRLCHERQLDSCPATLPRAGTGYIRPGNGELEEGCFPGVGQAKGRRGAIARGCHSGVEHPEPSQLDVAVGEFVGLVAEDSTLQKPSIFQGRVQAFLPDGQVCLLWYRIVGGGVYSLQVDDSLWTESRVPMEVVPAKGRAHTFRL